MSMNDSWYRASVGDVTQRDALQGDITSDVCIVGAGFTGLSAALELAEAGVRVTVLEAEQVGWGCSGRNGGQINPGLGCDHGRVVAELGADDARKVWQLTLDGVELLRSRVKRHNIDCDLKAGILLVANKARQVPELQSWQHELEALGYDQLAFYDRDALQSLLKADYQAGVMDWGGGDLHPLKYALGLASAAEAAGAQILERSAVLGYEEDGRTVTIRTAAGQVHAQHLLLAGNAYLGKLLPWYRKGFMPIGSYVGATRPLGELATQLIPSRAAVCDMNTLIDYYRLSADNRLLFGGRASARDAQPNALRATMRERMALVFPALAEEDFEYLWGGQVAMTMSKAPVFGRLGRRTLFAQGYSGQGVALAGMAGKLMAQTVQGDAAGFDLMARAKHWPVPPGAPLQTAIRALALLWYRLQDSR